jgi:hypothetical protein
MHPARSPAFSGALGFGWVACHTAKLPNFFDSAAKGNMDKGVSLKRQVAGVITVSVR